MPIARREPSDSRVIAHIDMDCFYVQVEQRKRPELRGLPTAVVQYNSWKGGGLIAVGYEARRYGVKRSMRGDEAKQACPQINLVQVPVARDKADLNIYRSAGSEVVSILARRGRCERASIDEVYLDLSDAAETMLAENPPGMLEVIHEEALKSHVLGIHENGEKREENVREWICRADTDHRDKLLACGAIIVAELRMQVLKETEFTCSAGIAHNKMLAKLASGMNKPAQQTIVPLSAVQGLLASLPVKKMKQLGGKLGSSLQNELGVNTVGDILKFQEEKLQECYGINTGTWLWNIARGMDGDEVEGRLLPKSHGCGKTFPGPRALKTMASVEQWLHHLCEELNERIQSDLDQNKRVAHCLTLHARAYKTNDSDSQKNFPSRSCPLRYGAPKIQKDALKLFDSALREFLGSNKVDSQGDQKNAWGVTSLSVTASKILAMPSGTCSIMRYFSGPETSCSSEKQISGETTQGSTPFSGDGRCSHLNKTELSQKLTYEESSVDCDNIDSNQDEQRTEKGNSEERDGITFDHVLPFLPSGHGTDNCPGLNQSKVESMHTKKETRIDCVQQSERHGGHNLKPGSDKGTCSIMKFFHPCSPSCFTSQQDCDRMVDGTARLASGNESCSGSKQFEPVKSFSETWRFNADEIDPSVIDELPSEIQAEIQGWLRPQKCAKTTAKRGSSIAHYFTPVKKENTDP